jgi:hypothetical protein
MALHRRSGALAIISIAILLFAALVPVGFMQTAQAANETITTDTTWTNKTINSGDAVHVSQRATLTITGTVVNNGEIFVNSGSSLVINSGASLTIANHAEFWVLQDPAEVFPGETDVAGRLRVNSGGLAGVGSDALVVILNGGNLDINSGGLFMVNGELGVQPGGRVNVDSDAGLTLLLGTVNLSGTIIVDSLGTVTVQSQLLKINPGGRIDLAGTLRVGIFGTVNNLGTINLQCDGTIELLGSYAGNPAVDLCVSYPITHMSDTTKSTGAKLHKGGTTIIAESLTSKSQLKGDKIDEITIRLRKYGSPTGDAVVGIYSTSGALKKQFGVKDVSTLTTSFKDYTFKLSGGQLYTLVSGDKIGIKFAGGSSANSISVMQDTSSAGPFDGVKSSLRKFSSGSWSGSNTNDMYMILRQTHG